MAFLLVPTDLVRTALRIDSGESDELIEVYISAASRAVYRYLKRPEDFTPTGNSPGDSPPSAPPDDPSLIDERVQFAVISLTGILYREPDGDAAKNFAETGQLPYVVTALLYSERLPTLA